MAMTEFEKKLISELKGIRNELHDLNKRKSEKVEMNEQIVSNAIANTLHEAMIVSD